MVARVLSLALIPVGLLIAACSSTAPPPRPVAQINFTKPVVVAPAAEFAVLDTYKAPKVAPNVEHDHTVQPAQIVSAWVDKRLRASPMNHGKLTITVTEASVVQEPLAMDKTLKAKLTQRQQESKLSGTLKWRVSYSGPMLPMWSSDGVAQATGTVLEQSSLNDVDLAYAAIIENIAKNFDMRVEEQLATLRVAQAEAADQSGH